MTRDQVNEYLHAYQENKGRYLYLKEEITRLEMLMHELHCTAEGDEAFKGKGLSGMPYGGGKSDPTARIAVKLASGDMTDAMRDLYRELRTCCQERDEKQRACRYVEAWIKGLPERERWVIQRQMLDGRYWRELPNLFQKEIGEYYSQEGLKALKKRAMSMVQKMAQ